MPEDPNPPSRSWKKIADEAAKESDPRKLTLLIEALIKAFQRETAQRKSA